mmetsp:Transcript_111232/g.309768  ORF Transcript_111232/g.309768 Transcript_111232/m.309768 type:complete len:526 (+) Transcript_111232:68-1645(+)
MVWLGTVMEAHNDELHSDIIDPKASRAISRCRHLRIEKTKYLRSCAKGEVCYQKVPAKRARHRARHRARRHRATPHRSARTVTRTVLAKGKLEMAVDVPTISVDRGRKWVPRLRRSSMGRGGNHTLQLRKPGVSPLLPARPADVAAVEEDDQEEMPDMFEEPSGVPDCLEPSGVRGRATSEIMEVKDTSCHTATSASHAASITHDAAIQALYRAMNLQDLGSSVASLRQLISRDPRNFNSTMDVGTVQRLLRAMQEHYQSAVAQEMACRLLGCIMSCGADFRTRVASCGGVKATLTAMAMHRSSAAVQEAGCHSLKGLAARSPTIQKDILSSSGIEAVLDAMKNHTCHATVQASGCGVLRNIGVGNVQHQLKIACLGGIQLVLAALAMHRMEADVQCAGCWALFCLSVQNRPVQAQAVTAGAVSCVLQAMKMHPAAAEVQEAGCWALKELVAIDGSDVGSWFDSVHAVSKALREVPSKGVQAAARAALQTLAKGSAMPCPPRTVEASNLKRRRFALSRDLTPIME